MQFIDANLFLRLITGDHANHSPRAYAFFKLIEADNRKATTSESVLTEIVHVLSSPKTYRLPRQEVAERLRTILRIKGLLVPNADAFWEAATCYERSKIDFVDCLSVAHMKRLGIDEIVSFDGHFDRFPDITRVEPE